ncbi:MAG: SpoIIE family protein phosphatase [Deltaproteobacteria bacterium]|jgi:serine/threonine protein phosphatase PrpC|nr:SpoIIE family protein phosphatase [Deltaproteobacteria bacterium]
MPPSQKELEKLAQLLDREPHYELLDLSQLKDPDDIAAVRRYKAGDLVRVARSSGEWSLGVVSGRAPDDRLKVLVRSNADGQLSIKEPSHASILKANPLKIGDYVQLGPTPFWVAGLDTEGEILVLTRSGQRVDPKELRARIEEQLHRPDRDADRTIDLTAADLARIRGEPPSVVTTRPLTGDLPIKPGPYVPIEEILHADSGFGMFAGNRETDTVYNLKSPIAGAALHTARGHNYKSWNEDSGALFADNHGRLFLGVFDQAGGEGSDEKARGAASALAAQMMFEEMQKVAENNGDDQAAEFGLVKAAQRAHEAILARGKGEVTTFVGAMIESHSVVIVNIGDSGAQHYSRDGQHLASTEAQGVGRLLLEGLGMLRKESFNHVTYRWEVSAGDYLVFGSDGLFDSKLKPEEIGALLSKAGNAADATRRLRDEVSERMKSKKGKPDNLTVLVVRVGDPADTTLRSV